MSAIQVHPLPRGSARVLMLSTLVMTVAAAAVLAVGTQDARLLRLGLVAALWAALLGAFAAAQMRREAHSYAEHANQLRTTYRLELEREVSARREHALRVEHELRKQAERSAQCEMMALRAELAAMRANLELLSGAPQVERVTLAAGSTRALPLPPQPRSLDGNRVPTAAPASRGRTGPVSRFSPSWPETSSTAPAALPVGAAVSDGLGSRHDVSARQGSRSEVNHSLAFGQRTVGDLLAANGGLPTPRRRRSHANPE
jgi:hypothetical protein